MYKKIIVCLLTLTLVFTSVNFGEVQAAKLKLNKTNTYVRIGTPLKLKVKNTKKKVKWKSSNKKIATVSKKGVVKGKKYGKCYITAKVGKKKLKCRCFVTHKVAKKITAKTMSKIAKKIKSKGSYNGEKKCYVYRKRYINNDEVIGAFLYYYPSTNHILFNVSDQYFESNMEFHVGDKEYFKFNAKSYQYDVTVEGKCNKRKVGEGQSCITITNTTIPESYYYTAQKTLYEYLGPQTGMLEDVLKELKTNVYGEDLGFSFPLAEK